MNAGPTRWRRLALKLVQHAAWVLPGAGSPWAEAMCHELDYIEDDPAAVRWALGCILASYRARLTHPPRIGVRTAWRHAATCGALMLLIGLALQDRAGGQTEPPRPAFHRTTCDPPDVSVAGRGKPQCDTVSGPRRDDDPCKAAGAADLRDHVAPAADASCADRRRHEADDRLH